MRRQLWQLVAEVGIVARTRAPIARTVASVRLGIGRLLPAHSNSERIDFKDARFPGVPAAGSESACVSMSHLE
jgi:hypothetical protein